ncbi:YciI family protein [Terrabacter sp. NPDC000476]|uniref:YciI family protein n=1 Tax=Terrabacter sp. NPDC000476 TaxID=3154258 RepID=UPI00331CBB35
MRPAAPDRAGALTGMARYLLAVYGPDEPGEFGSYPSREAMLESFADTGAFNEMLERRGHLVFADGLEPASTATTVDGQGAKPVLSDGPYLETKEHLGGFWVIEAPDLDVALDLAGQASKACRGTVEVRPFRSAESVRALVEP